MATAAPFKWTIEIEVSADWVQDGFMLSDGRARDMIGSQLRFATSEEYSARDPRFVAEVLKV